jgi:hypothetical protein
MGQETIRRRKKTGNNMKDESIRPSLTELYTYIDAIRTHNIKQNGLAGTSIGPIHLLGDRGP